MTLNEYINLLELFKTERTLDDTSWVETNRTLILGSMPAGLTLHVFTLNGGLYRHIYKLQAGRTICHERHVLPIDTSLLVPQFIQPGASDLSFCLTLHSMGHGLQFEEYRQYSQYPYTGKTEPFSSLKAA